MYNNKYNCFSLYHHFLSLVYFYFVHPSYFLDQDDNGMVMIFYQLILLLYGHT